MRYIKIPFLLLWRIWFYVFMFVTILTMSPLLLILTAKESYYPALWKLIRAWSHLLLYSMGFWIKVDFEQKTERDKSYVFCSNHTSFLDPFVLIALSKNPIVFVGKQELAKIPVFGFFYKRMVIMVDRSSLRSKKRVYDMAKKRLHDGVSVGIFPEGLVPEEDVILSPFKNGAFNLAIEFQIPIVPQTYYDCKRFFSWDYFKGGMGKLRIKQHKFIETKGLTLQDVKNVREKTFVTLYNELVNDELYMQDTLRKK